MPLLCSVSLRHRHHCLRQEATMRQIWTISCLYSTRYTHLSTHRHHHHCRHHMRHFHSRPTLVVDSSFLTITASYQHSYSRGYQLSWTQCTPSRVLHLMKSLHLRVLYVCCASPSNHSQIGPFSMTLVVYSIFLLQQYMHLSIDYCRHIQHHPSSPTAAPFSV